MNDRGTLLLGMVIGAIIVWLFLSGKHEGCGCGASGAGGAGGAGGATGGAGGGLPCLIRSLPPAQTVGITYPASPAVIAPM